MENSNDCGLGAATYFVSTTVSSSAIEIIVRQIRWFGRSGNNNRKGNYCEYEMTAFPSMVAFVYSLTDKFQYNSRNH